MSGIYLIVWDADRRHASRLLRATRGGYPHITLAHTGAYVLRGDLLRIAADALHAWALQPIVLTGARVHSFVDQHGAERHDVLMSIANEADIEASRDALIREPLDDDTVEHCTMRQPHITAGIFSTLAQAQECALAIAPEFPYTVVVTGVTID
jgi:hypothetical protein